MTKKPVPGSSRVGNMDTRSTDVGGKQADEVASHAERAQKKPSTKAESEPARDEAAGAMKDQVGH
jgi:hypothetical protein